MSNPNPENAHTRRLFLHARPRFCIVYGMSAGTKVVPADVESGVARSRNEQTLVQRSLHTLNASSAQHPQPATSRVKRHAESVPTAQGQEKHATFLLIILGLVQVVTYLVSLFNQFSIKLAGKLVCQWLIGLIFASNLASTKITAENQPWSCCDRPCRKCPCRCHRWQTMMGIFLLYVGYWTDTAWRCAVGSTIEGLCGPAENKVTTLLVDFVGPLMVYAYMRYTTQALLFISKKRKTPELAAKLHMQYLKLAPVVYFLFLAITSKLIEEPRLDANICQLIQQSVGGPTENKFSKDPKLLKARPIAHWENCSAAQIKIPNPVLTVEDLKLEAAIVDRAANYVSYFVQTLEGAQLSLLFYVWIALVHIRGEYATDTKIEKRLMSCRVRCSCSCCCRTCIWDWEFLRWCSYVKCYHMKLCWPLFRVNCCADESKDFNHITGSEFLLCSLTCIHLTLVAYMETLSLEVLEYDDFMGRFYLCLMLWMILYVMITFNLIYISCASLHGTSRREIIKLFLCPCDRDCDVCKGSEDIPLYEGGE